MSTHLEAELLDAYATGQIDAPHAFSVEAHVVGCAQCQAAIGELVDRSRLERVFTDVRDQLDAPRAGAIETLLRWLRVPEHLARLLAGTPSLSLSWLGAVALALSFGVLAAYAGERGVLMFLCLAALLPVAGVAASFSPGVDRSYEIAAAAPFSSVHLLLLRTAAVLPTTIAMAGVAALALPGVGWSAAAWLLPSLALTLASLALATFVSALIAFVSISSAWLAAVLLTAAASADRLAIFDATAQLAFIALGACAAVVLASRHDRLDVRRTL
ncbi:MAG: zf-HC2 domain-containing protein [Actinobacteria bacterium]|nr:zf-HC2 domain-containing protein [Actinomycetota bacterium]